MPPPTEEQIAARQAWVLDSLDRRMTIVEGLASGAGEPLDWLGLQRQVRNFVAKAESAPRARMSDAVQAAFDDHIAALQTVAAQVDKELSAADPDELAAARARLGLRVAIIGKGGAGKTVLSSTLARILARRGRPVVAVDLDTCPGLAFSLGVPVTGPGGRSERQLTERPSPDGRPVTGPGGRSERQLTERPSPDGRSVTEAGLPDEALEEQPAAPYGWQLSGAVTPDEAVDRFSVAGPDGIRFLGLGKIGSADKDQARRSVAAIRQILVGFSAPGTDLVADLEAGPTTPFEGYHEFAEHVVVVVGPAWRSAMTARRLLPMVGERRMTIVGNRFRDEPDHPGLPAAVRIPDDPDLTQTEREGRSPFDACPDSPAVHAVARLADLLLAESAAG